VTFGPEGTDLPDPLSLLGPPVDVQEKRDGPSYGQIIPRRLLIAQIRDSRILLPVGKSLTFVAPWTGPLSFRVNDETKSPQAVTGDLRVTLERITQPALVDKEGKTTISTRVSKTKYLLFEPEGIRWQFSSYQSALEEPEYPTLLNGIVWWPLPDKPNTEGWRELTLKNQTLPLKTRAFAWAANSTGVKPEVTMLSADSGAVTSEGPSDAQPGLTFSGDTNRPCRVDCVFSNHDLAKE